MPALEAKGLTGSVELEPYWWRDARPARDESPAAPTEVDAAVVGAGYAGLSAALTLARAGRVVAVFERDVPGLGASTRNGGGIGRTVKPALSKLAAKLGLARAKAYYEEGARAVQFAVDFIAREGIDCHLTMCGRFLGAHTRADYRAMAQEIAFQHEHLGTEASMIPRSEQHREIGTESYHGGAVWPDGGTIQPAMWHRGLLMRARESGASIVGGQKITAIRRERDRFELATPGGRVSAREVIVATNGYTEAITPWLQRRIIPIQSQIIVTEPLPSETAEEIIPRRRMCGDTCRLHHYYRLTPDGARLVFGGRAGADRLDPRRSGAHLYRRMTTLFPQLRNIQITHAWTGMTGYTFDTLPHVGVHDGIHYVAGFCGSGVALAAYLGHKTALRSMGASEASTAFDLEQRPFPTRPLYQGRPWFLPPVLLYYGALDWLRL